MFNSLTSVLLALCDVKENSHCEPLQLWYACDFVGFAAPLAHTVRDLAVLEHGLVGQPGIKVEGEEEFVKKKPELAYPSLKFFFKRWGEGKKTTEIGDFCQVYHRFEVD